MERLTAYDGDYYYPHCMRGSTCDGHGPSEKCKECEFDERVCVTLGKYEDSGLTPEQIQELKERDKPRKIELNAGVPTCPVCGRRVVRCYDFCPDCGQRLEQ